MPEKLGDPLRACPMHPCGIDRELIVALRNAAPALLATVEAQRKEIDEAGSNYARAERELSNTVEECRVLFSERDALHAEVERLRARHDWMLDQAAWLRHEHTAYVAVPVPLSSDLSCKAARAEAVDRAFQASRAALRGEEASRG